MPASNPGSLSAQQYIDVIGYILTKQVLLTGGQIVTTDTLDSIKLAQ